VKFAFIAEKQVAFPVGAMCRALGVSSSGYYEWRKRLPGPRTKDDAWLAIELVLRRIALGAGSGNPRINLGAESGEPVDTSPGTGISLARLTHISETTSDTPSVGAVSAPAGRADSQYRPAYTASGQARLDLSDRRNDRFGAWSSQSVRLPSVGVGPSSDRDLI